MHLASQSSGKLDKLSQGSSKLDKLSQNSMGHTLDKREATDSRGKNSSRRILQKQSSESREVEQRGMLGQGTARAVDYPCCRKL